MLKLIQRSIRNPVIPTKRWLAPSRTGQGFRKYSLAVVTTQNTSKKNDSTPDKTSSATLDVIKSNVATRERLRYATLNEYVDSLNEPITTENISFLYECIARYLPQVASNRKADLIAKLWTKVKLWKSPSQEDYVSWLKAHRECGTEIRWSELEQELDHVEPCMKLLEELLYLVSTSGQSDETLHILDLIKEQEFPLTEKIFNALIVAHSRDKNVESFESVLELMTMADLSPNNETQFEMARAYIHNEMWPNSQEVIDLADFSTHQLMALLKSSLLQGATDEWVTMLVQKLPKEVLQHREISPVFKNFLIELVHIHNRPSDVLLLLKCLPKPPQTTASENEDLYGAFIIHELFEANQSFAVITSICDFLVTDGRNRRAAFVATEISLRRHSPQSMDFLRFLATFESLKPHYFWSLFIAEFQTNGEQGVIDLIVEMKSLNVDIDADTITTYVLPRLPLILKDIKSGIQMITESGIRMSVLSMPLLLQLLAVERYDDFNLVLNTYPSCKVPGEQLLGPLVKSVQEETSTPRSILKVLKTLLDRSILPENADLNGSFLLEMTGAGKLVHLPGFITEMLKLKIKISGISKSRLEGKIATAKSLSPDQKDQLLDSVKRLPTDESTPLSSGAAFLESKHPRDMNFADLESHFAELTEKEMNTRGILRKLLQLAVKEKRFEKALEFKAKCDEFGMDFSPGMLASCIELYTRMGTFEQAKAAWDELEKKYPKFVIDDHKAIDFAAFVIKSKKDNMGVEEAKQLLIKRATQKVVVGENSNKNVWHLLGVLSELSINSGEHLTKSFLDFLVKHKYCRHTNTLLGPLVREWLLKKDLRNAIIEYKDIVKRHRKTPLNLELLTILVGLKNGQHEEYGTFTEVEVMDMISDVFKAVEQVHGLPAAKTSLLFATAEGGTDKQVRKILMDPNMRIDPQALHRQCEYLGRAGKTDALFRLIKSSRGLSHNIINESQLWSVLMQTLAKQNHIDEAVRLFDRLLEEDEFKLTKEIAVIVIDLLKRNNLELPSRLQTFNV